MHVRGIEGEKVEKYREREAFTTEHGYKRKAHSETERQEDQ